MMYATDVRSGVPVAGLDQLTDRPAVQRAIDEFLDLGPDQFLALHGQEGSRDYFVHVGDQLVDAKPILSVAYGYQHPQHGPLSVQEFSGGAEAVRTLARLGFQTVTRAQLNPPGLGEEYANRTEIYEAYGGDRVAGINRFPGDGAVNVFCDADGPDADDLPRMGEPFAYRGEGLVGPQRLNQRGNALLERARISRTPVRFWYKPAGGKFAFLAWVAVLGRAWVNGVDEAGAPRPELEWQLATVPGPSTATWPTEILETVTEADTATNTDSPEPPIEAEERASYADLVQRVEDLGQPRRPDGVVRTSYHRSAAARRAVLTRSGGVCESPRCTGMPAEPNRQGKSILDVAHVEALGRGGEDHPRNMVALCPNCHACKTRGSKTATWRRELLRIAAEAHNAQLTMALNLS